MSLMRWTSNKLILAALFLLLLVGLFYIHTNKSSQITLHGSFLRDGITVEEMVTSLRQNDSRILEYIRKHHLTPPSTLPYNLTHPDKFDGDRVRLTPTIAKLLNNLQGGFFIEAGSNDGELMSSTLGFERKDGWTGLCVEPSPIQIPIWKTKQRKAWLADVCLSPVPVPMGVSFLHKHNGSTASRIGLPVEIGMEKGTWSSFSVPCFPIFSLLSAMNVDTVDFFNLDVEGAEMAVLRTVPFKEILIKTISVELHEHDQKAKVSKALKDFMTSEGYIVAMDRYPDFIFAHPSLYVDTNIE